MSRFKNVTAFMLNVHLVVKCTGHTVARGQSVGIRATYAQLMTVLFHLHLGLVYPCTILARQSNLKQKGIFEKG